MIASDKLPETLSTLYAGDLIKAWICCCWKCQCWALDMAADGNTMKTDAMSHARRAGWSKTIAGWLCPACKEENTRAT